VRRAFLSVPFEREIQAKDWPVEIKVLCESLIGLSVGLLAGSVLVWWMSYFLGGGPAHHFERSQPITIPARPQTTLTSTWNRSARICSTTSLRCHSNMASIHWAESCGWLACQAASSFSVICDTRRGSSWSNSRSMRCFFPACAMPLSRPEVASLESMAGNDTEGQEAVQARIERGAFRLRQPVGAGAAAGRGRG